MTQTAQIQAKQPKKPLSVGQKLSAYLALTKPRVIELLLITTVPVMILAQQGIPNLWLVLATLIGGALSAGSANAFNCIIDTDIDKIMGRTQKRPLVTGDLSKLEAQVFATAIGLISVLWLGFFVNWLSAGLALAAELFYIFIYTLLLKRRTAQNIVWGGAAGAMPVLIGFSAVTNSLSWSAAVLFLIIFLWTPPHYWPLSMKYKEDYASAGVPMLPVVSDIKVVAKQIVIYSYVMVASTLLLIPVAPMGLIYTAAAVLGGAWFIAEAHILQGKAKRDAVDNPMRLFHFSITYLTVLFIAVGVDPLFFIKLI
ncbi:MAG: protoheme IX farnesyltransferase [Actinobacteria bacterium]|uniref:Protoheme IX farnesyltransferase n=1 Tax=freshwater metagenome TaxID=449393 RepID=A0A6J6NX34_9ZZZZ|nr:protoheme IX farnesyltransferase [Actinomycetota bacterium]